MMMMMMMMKEQDLLGEMIKQTKKLQN